MLQNEVIDLLSDNFSTLSTLVTLRIIKAMAWLSVLEPLANFSRYIITALPILASEMNFGDNMQQRT